MPKPAPEIRKGKYIKFRVDDIHLPNPTAVFQQLHAGEIRTAQVVDLSQGGRDGGFVVIKVKGLRQRCILAVERILRVL